MPVTSAAAASYDQRPEQFFDMRFEPRIEPRLDGLARRAGQMLVGDEAHARMHALLAGIQLADRGAGPADGAVARQHELGVRRLGKPRGARGDLAGQRLLRGVLQGLRLRAAR